MSADLACLHLTTLAEVPPDCMQVLTTAPPPPPLPTPGEIAPDDPRGSAPRRAALLHLLLRVRCRRSHAHARMQVLTTAPSRIPTGTLSEIACSRSHASTTSTPSASGRGWRERRAARFASSRRSAGATHRPIRIRQSKAALAEATSARGNSHLQAIHTSGDVCQRQPLTTEPL